MKFKWWWWVPIAAVGGYVVVATSGSADPDNMTPAQSAFYEQARVTLSNLEAGDEWPDVTSEFAAAYPMQVHDAATLVEILLTQGFDVQTGVSDGAPKVDENGDYSFLLRKSISIGWRGFGAKPQIVIIGWREDEVARLMVNLGIHCLFC